MCYFFLFNNCVYDVHIFEYCSTCNVSMAPYRKNESESFICDVCQCAFKRKYHLKLHIESVHFTNKARSTKKIKIRCFYCNTEFQKSAQYDEHLQKKHEFETEIKHLAFENEAG